MQDRPTATELLDDVAELLAEEVLPVLDGPVRHHVRVAANVCRIVAREVQLGPDNDARETAALRELVPDAPTVQAAHERLAEELRSGNPGSVDDDRLVRIRRAFLAITRDKLAVTKPGYDDFTYAGERPEGRR